MPGLLSMMNKKSSRRSSDPAAMALDHGEDLWKKTLGDISAEFSVVSCDDHEDDHTHTQTHTHTTDCQSSEGSAQQRRASLLKKKHNSSPNNKKPIIRRSVSFGKVEVRVCERVLGDNIACGRGPCLALGWHICHQETLDLEEYEWKRQREAKNSSSSSTSSSSTAKRLSCQERTKLARKNGLSRQEIDENIKLIRKLGGGGGGGKATTGSNKNKSSSNFKSLSSGLGLFGTNKGRDSAQQALALPPKMMMTSRQTMNNPGFRSF